MKDRAVTDNLSIGYEGLLIATDQLSIDYEETYAPVVQWATIRFFISLAILSNWHTRQLDFVLAYTQADIERDLYMKLPAGFTLSDRTITDQDRKDYVLKLEKNLYGQKQAGRVWYLHLRKNLLKLGFKPSEHDECVFYYGCTDNEGHGPSQV